MAITIKDVAKLAGVSYQTVSRVINDSTSVKEDTRLRVLAAIKKLNYYPNQAARNIHGNSIYSIGLTIPFSGEDIRGNPFFMEVIGTISKICTYKGIALNIFTFDENNEDVELLIRLYKEKVISGIILTCPTLDEKSLIELKYHEIPVVVIGRPGAQLNISYVDSDNITASYEATKHMIGLGHRSIALINGPAFMTLSEDLLRGYSTALQEAGIALQNEYVINSKLEEEDAESKTKILLENRPEITAAFCATDFIALGLMKSAFDFGMNIPDDLSIISRVYSTWNSFLKPSLTATKDNYSLLGKHSIEILLKIIEKKQDDYERIVIPYEMVFGESCGPVKTKNSN